MNEFGIKVSLVLLFDDIEFVVLLLKFICLIFIYIKFNIVNNKNLMSLFGIFIYVNVLDILKMFDLMFDLYY